MATKGDSEQNGNGEKGLVTGDVLISITDLLRAKTRPNRDGVIKVAPEELGLDRDEFGFGPSARIALHFRPLNDGELAEIRDQIKDFEEPHYTREYFEEIVRRCLVEPAIPDSAEGRNALKAMASGTKETIARAVLNQSGMGLHEVKSAKEELGKLSRLIGSTASS